MGTNFYWRKIPQEFQKYQNNVYEVVSCYDARDSVLKHIGKRSGAGLYCYDCGTTLHRLGTDYVHSGEGDWYPKCPICGREGSPMCTFRWTFMKHKWLVQKLANEGCTEKLIIDEYGDEYTPLEFLGEVETPVEFQTCQEFT